jgi:hypothetical protein
MKICLECGNLTRKNECCGSKTVTKNQLRKQIESGEEYLDWKTLNWLKSLYQKF